MKTRSLLLLITLAGIGCAGLPGTRGSVPEHLRTDGDRYADAICEAVDAYSDMVESATQVTYASEAEAHAVARSIGPGQLERILARTLGRRGMTLRGLDVYASHHPELLEAQRALHAPRMARLAQAARTLRVDTRMRPIVAFDEPAAGSALTASAAATRDRGSVRESAALLGQRVDRPALRAAGDEVDARL